MSYCRAVDAMSAERRAIHQPYHDTRYGFPVHDDDELFGRLVMEINQAGLSWELILKKEAAFRQAFDDFSIEKVAAYTETDRKRLLADAGIIRNRLKINAAIENARTIQRLQSEHGSFEQWLECESPKPLADWVNLFKKTFRFTGGEIVHSFLMSIGYLPGAHDESCFIHRKILRSRPKWQQIHQVAAKK